MRSSLIGGLGLADGLRWHDGRLWFSDLALGRVVRLDPDGRPDLQLPVTGRPSGLGWLPDGQLLVVAMHRRAVLRYDGTAFVIHADLGGLVPADLNDMVVDGEGNAYVSGFGYDAGSEPQRVPTGMVLVHPDGSASMQPGELYRPNGCVITGDGDTLIVAETRLHRLSAFTVRDDAGLSNQRTFAVLPRGTWADGICLDEHGGVWVADPKGRQCLRVEDGGEITHRIDTSPDPAVCCVLGGPEGRTLFVSVGPVRPHEENARDPQGRIHAYAVESSRAQRAEEGA